VENGVISIKLNLEGKIESDHYAMMGLYKLANQKSAPKSLHSSRNKSAIIADMYTPFELATITSVSHNSSIFRFRCADKAKLLVPIGHHITIRISTDNGYVMRDYTPITDEIGYFDLLIKLYKDGPISSFIFSMKIGEQLEMKGPEGILTYIPNQYVHMGMIAGGTGITPMYQVIKACLSNPGDRTKLTLLFANRTEEDILLKQQLDLFAKEHKDRFQVHYLLSQPIDESYSLKGRINMDIIKSLMPAPSVKTQILLCGTDDFCELALGLLREIGHTQDHLHMF